MNKEFDLIAQDIKARIRPRKIFLSDRFDVMRDIVSAWDNEPNRGLRILECQLPEVREWLAENKKEIVSAIPQPATALLASLELDVQVKCSSVKVDLGWEDILVLWAPGKVKIIRLVE